MLYTISTDSEGYVLSISHTKYDNIELDLSEIDTEYLNAYFLDLQYLILDNDKKQKMIDEKQQEAKETEINMLKKYLSDTDYVISETFEKTISLNNAVTFISDFIKILVQSKTKYSEILEQRKVWRNRIEELSK